MGSTSGNFDKQSFAKAVKGFLNGTALSSKLGFGMKVVENFNQQMPCLAFSVLGEIPIPVTLENKVRLQEASVLASQGLWEMNLNAEVLQKQHPAMMKFLSQTILMVSNLALRQMNYNVVNLRGLQVEAKKLIIMEPGSGFLLDLAESSTPGVLATLIAQFPVEGGHQGGQIRVLQGDRFRNYDNAPDSSRLFYYTVLESQSHHEMDELTAGWRLAMKFDLVCTDPVAPIYCNNSSNELAAMLHQFAKEDRFMAFPLDKSGTSFSALTGNDRRLADLLTSYDFLQLHLTTVCRVVVGQPDQPLGCECCWKRGCHCQQISMAVVCKEETTVVKWIEQNDVETANFDQLNVQNELMGDETLFSDPPDNEIWKENLLEQKFYRSVLVVWPKKSSIYFDCRHRFGFLLDNLESLADSKREEAIKSLKEVAQVCRGRPEVIRRNGQCSLRLLQLCLALQTADIALDLLQTVATHEGVSSNAMAETIAEIVRLLGGQFKPDLMALILSPERAILQMGFYVHYINSLLTINCLKEASSAADRISRMFNGDFATSLEILVLANCINLMLQLEENPQTNNLGRLALLSSNVKTNFTEFQRLLKLLTRVYNFLKSRPAPIPAIVSTWYREMCLHFAQLPIFSSIPPAVVLLAIRFLLHDVASLEVFARRLINNQEMLHSILSLEETWNLVQYPGGKEALSFLVDGRIQWLSTLPRPTETWEIPDAIVPNHPEVEKFMRSNQQLMVYANFNNLPHARNWARKHFSRSELFQYGTAVPGGIGGRAYCTITKNRKRQQAVKSKFEKYESELLGLIDKRLRKLGDVNCSIVLNAKTEEICLVTPQSQSSAVPPPQVAQTVAKAKKKPTEKQLGEAKRNEIARILMANECLKAAKGKKILPKPTAAAQTIAKPATSTVMDGRIATKVANGQPSAGSIFVLKEDGTIGVNPAANVKKDATPFVPITETPLRTSSTPKRARVAKRPLVFDAQPAVLAPVDVNAGTSQVKRVAEAADEAAKRAKMD